MCLGDIIEDVYYTDRTLAERKLKQMNDLVGEGDFWIKELVKFG
jgi:hypothetical protein